MALGYAEALRNARLDEITARAGSGALLRIYSGTRPATGGTPTTLLAELVCGSPFAPAASGGVLTAGTISDDTSANSSGTATWFRLVASNGTTHVLDGSVSGSGGGGDMELSSTSIVELGTVSISSFVITAGNA
jgi:hypothetical protein